MAEPFILHSAKALSPGFPLHKKIAEIKVESLITSFYNPIYACTDFFSSFSLHGKLL